MANKSTVSLGIDNLLEDRQMLSVAPVPPLDNFRDPTATIRVLDQAQQNIVGVTREGRSAIADAFFTQGMGYGWQMSKISNGQETDPGYGSNVLGKADTYGFGTEAAPEVVRVTPSFTLEVINNNQLKITWSNMNTSQGACWFRCGWLGDRIVWNPEGTTTINVPNTTGDPKFDQIGVTGPWGELWTGITYRIQGGHFTQVPSSSNYTFAGWATWSRTLPNDDIGTSGIENHGGDKTIGNVTLHTHEVLVHPGKSEDVAFTWTSQAAGTASIQAILQDARAGMGDGVRYTIQRIKADGTETTTLSSGVIVDGGNLGITEGALSVAVGVGDKIKLIVCAKGTGTDPNDDKWDTIRVIKLEVKLTEAEKTYEKVTVAPSIQLRTTNNGNTLFVDYRNMPEGMKLRAMRRGIQWNDGDWGKTEVSLPQGSGSSWVSFNAWSGDISVYPVDIWLVDANSDNEPIEEKKLSFTMQGNTSSPLSGVPTTRMIYGSRANDVLKDPGVARTEVDYAEELAVSAYLQYKTTPPARDWTDGKVFDQTAKARQFGALTQSDLMNEPLNGNGSLYKIFIPSATTKYERQSILTDGSFTIERVLYVKEDGLYKLPQEYYDRSPDGGIITKGTGPAYIVLDMRLTGHFSRAAFQGDTLAEVQPLPGQHIVGGIERITPQPTDQPGWRDMILDIQQGPSAVLNPGSTVCVFAQLNGAGSEGGMITLRAYCTYDGNIANAQPQYTTTTSFGASQRKTVFFNMYAPLPGPSSDARGIITMEVEYADHRREVIANRLTRSLGYDEVERAAFMKANKEAYAKMPMLNGSGIVIGMGGVLFKDQPTLALQYMQLNGTNPVAGSEEGYDNALYNTGISGVGGADIPPASLETLQRAIARYTNGMTVAGVNARTETLMGKIILGAISKILANPSISSQQPIFKDLAEITGISEWKIARATRLMAISVPQDKYNRNCPSVEQSKAQLMELFSYAGFSSAFGANQGNPLPGIISMSIGKPNYTLADKEINVRFNLAASLNGYDAVRLYVRKNNGDLVSTPIAATGNSGTMYLKASVASVLGAIGTNNPTHVTFVLKADKGGQTYQAESAGLIVEQGAILDLSTSTENAERKLAEDKILTQIAQNFPLQNPSLRKWTLGSGYHDGSEFNAADLNSLGGGDTDRGDSVKAVEDGVIRIGSSGSYTTQINNDLKFGAVVIEHQKAMGNQLAWKSIYLHMPIFATERLTPDGKKIFEVRYEGKIVELWDGKSVKAQEEIGFVGGRTNTNADGSYNEGIGNAHLHFVAKYAGISIDLRKGVFQAGISKAEAFDAGVDGNSDTFADGKTLDVTWSDALNLWVNTEYKLIYDRREQTPSSPGLTTNSYWLAWEDGKSIGQMKKVAWDKQSATWYQVGAAGDWAKNEQGKKIKWIKSNNVFTFVTENL